ncbi:FAD-dependent oxidoreductase [uncultured Desulfovibrio sp.]|uniref:FAD-dependent oxidoreductase n=1 Tax=uncultured Desulfovibrio sp. TaxID=167968 RepID=UPI0028058481|nr:FAD-dependent oxidoreductase [uncultured Desulfovibrio sp.]
MSEDIFDLIIVGAGPAGSAAALVAARAGLETLVVERGNFPGSKNMTGGRIYGHSLERLIPDFAREAPLERCVTRERVSLLRERDAVTLEYAAPEAADPASRSYTVLRAKFDQWLWSKAEESGAQLVAGIRVDELILEGGKVCGIKAGDEELRAHAVILADGVNSLLGQSLGMVRPLTPNACAVGVKEVLGFSPEQIRDRFGCPEKEGLAWLLAGAPSDGHMGGGFLYTNADSVSVGLVFGLQGVAAARDSVPQLFENFMKHPALAPYLEGGRLLEYSAHLVPEGGLGMVPRLVGDGVLVTGDAAGFCLNVGYTVRGMDLAIESGRCAAEAVIAARERGDWSAAGLRSYEELLERSFVLKDLRLYRKLPAALENERIFTVWPALACGVMEGMFQVNGPATPLRSRLWGEARRAGLFSLVRDGFSLLGAL